MLSKLGDHSVSSLTPFIMMMTLDIYFLILFSKTVILQSNHLQFDSCCFVVLNSSYNFSFLLLLTFINDNTFIRFGSIS